MNRQLTVQESRHKLARAICHGKRGQIMQAYRTGQDDQLGGVRPGPQRRRAVDHLDAPVEQPRALPAEAREHDVLNEDVARPRRSSTRTSTCWAATASAPPPRLAAACGPLRDPATANADEEG